MSIPSGTTKSCCDFGGHRIGGHPLAVSTPGVGYKSAVYSDLPQQSPSCNKSHGRRSPWFEFDSRPITVGEHGWIAAHDTGGEGATCW